MAQERFRRSEGNCMVVRAGDRVFVGGQVGLTLEGASAGLGDAGAQADQVVRDARTVLAAAGGGVEHIRKITTYLTDRAWRDAVASAIGRHLGAHTPAATWVIVAGLARPEMLVAIDIDAVVPA